MRHPWLCLPLALLLGACQPADDDADAADADEDPAAALRAGNTMRCTAGPLALEGRGEDVGLGSFGIHQGQLSLSLNLGAEQQGKVHVVSTSLMSIPLKTGTYSFPDAAASGPTYASYELRDSENNLLKDYSGPNYWFYYSAVEVDPAAKLKFVVEKLAVSSSPIPGMRRVHLSGSFTFNGAALPDNKQSEACSLDGIRRSINSLNGKRLLPMYDAKVCGAEKIHVQCRYAVAADLLSQ